MYDFYIMQNMFDHTEMNVQSRFVSPLVIDKYKQAPESWEKVVSCKAALLQYSLQQLEPSSDGWGGITYCSYTDWVGIQSVFCDDIHTSPHSWTTN